MYYDDYETNIFSDIENYKTLIKEQKNEISKREMIVDSLTDSLLKKIRSIIMPYSNSMLTAAYHQQTKTKKADKPMYEFIITDLTERLFAEDERKKVKFEKITAYGLDAYAYGFYFKYKDVVFELKIPVVKKIDKDNLHDAMYGKYILFYQESDHYSESIADSYNLDDIAEAIQNFVNES